MKTQERMVSLVMGTTMLLSSVTFMSGCNKSKADRKITGNSDWYDTKKVECKTGHEEENLSYSEFSNTFYSNGYIYGIFYANRNVSEKEMMDPAFDFNSVVINELIKYDLEGNIVEKQNLTDFVGNGYIMSCTPTGNNLTIMYTSYDADAGKSTDCVTTLNLEDGSTTDVTELPFEYNPQNGGVTDTILLSNGALFAMVADWTTDSGEYSFQICEDGKLVKKIDSPIENGESIYMLSSHSNDKDGNLQFALFTSKGDISYVLDINTYELKENTTTEISSSDLSVFNEAANGDLYDIDEEGIKKLNSTTLEAETALSFENCNINLYDVTYLDVLDAGEDHYILAGDVFESGGMTYTSTFTLYTLTKNENNPNIGKTRLIIGEVNGYVDAAMAEAIYRFNETSEDYFASVKLYETDVNYDDQMTDEEFEKQTMTATATMTNALAIELLSGDGPDVIMDAASISQLNSKDYLKDLTPITDKLSSDEYFTNVIDAAKTGDALYQLPISFIAEGIACEKQYAPSNGVGYTLPEYKELVSGPCNGKDPFQMSRTMFFLRGISIMSDLFIDPDNRKVDFKQDAFYDFAEYCLENVPEDSFADTTLINGGEIVEFETIEDYPAATWTYMSSLASYATLSSANNREYGFYGVASDGRGPCMEVYSSVAVSATTACEDGAYEFINILISEEIQYTSAKEYANCINKNALRQVCLDSIEVTNKNYELEKSYGTTDAQMFVWGIAKVDESMIDGYFECLEASSSFATIDPAVSLIIIEEASAYFNGQKSIEDVADLINNRAQTVMDER